MDPGYSISTARLPKNELRITIFLQISIFLFNGVIRVYFLVSCQISNQGVWVGLLWDKQQDTYCQVVRKSTLRLGKISSLVLIEPILDKIQLFTNLKINKRCMDCGTHTLDVYIFFLVNFGVFKWLYLIQYTHVGLINIISLRMLLTSMCSF